jgi:allantoicase
VHVFRGELAALGPVRFLRLNIYPDGGISRLRMAGRLAR